MAKIGDKVVVKCTCGKTLEVTGVESTDYDYTHNVYVRSHKCVAHNEDEGLQKLLDVSRNERAQLETKLENFKEFSQLMRGIK